MNCNDRHYEREYITSSLHITGLSPSEHLHRAIFLLEHLFYNTLLSLIEENALILFYFNIDINLIKYNFRR